MFKRGPVKTGQVVKEKSVGICNAWKLPLVQEISELQMVGGWEST